MPLQCWLLKRFLPPLKPHEPTGPRQLTRCPRPNSAHQGSHPIRLRAKRINLFSGNNSGSPLHVRPSPLRRLWTAQSLQTDPVANLYGVRDSMSARADMQSVWRRVRVAAWLLEGWLDDTRAVCAMSPRRLVGIRPGAPGNEICTLLGSMAIWGLGFDRTPVS